MEFDNVTNLDRKSAGNPTNREPLLEVQVRLSRPGKAMETKSLSTQVRWCEGHPSARPPQLYFFDRSRCSSR
jgi:hypothetical protein